MKKLSLKIIPNELLENYLLKVDNTLNNHFEKLTDSELSADTFSFHTSVSAVFSSKIEGENIELDSFIKHKKFDVKFLPDYTKKIDDLYDTYQFAKQQILNSDSLKAAHQQLTKTYYKKANRGNLELQTCLLLPLTAK